MRMDGPTDQSPREAEGPTGSLSEEKNRPRVARLTVKILLDVFMAVVLALLYNAHVLTLRFHEVAGIAILFVFLVHVLLNRAWVVKFGRRLFAKETPRRTKFSYWCSIALAVCFILIVVSGILISKSLFRQWFNDMGIQPTTSFWRPVHLFCSALSLALVGIHIGLYWDMVKSFFRKYIKLPKRTAKVVCTVVLLAMLVWGVYSIPTAGFTEWLLSPVTPQAHGGHEGGTSASGSPAGEQDASDEMDAGAAGADTAADAGTVAGERTGAERQGADDAQVATEPEVVSDDGHGPISGMPPRDDGEGAAESAGGDEAEGQGTAAGEETSTTGGIETMSAKAALGGMSVAYAAEAPAEGVADVPESVAGTETDARTDAGTDTEAGAATNASSAAANGSAALRARATQAIANPQADASEKAVSAKDGADDSVAGVTINVSVGGNMIIVIGGAEDAEAVRAAVEAGRIEATDDSRGKMASADARAASDEAADAPYDLRDEAAETADTAAAPVATSASASTTRDSASTERTVGASDSHDGEIGASVSATADEDAASSEAVDGAASRRARAAAAASATSDASEQAEVDGSPAERIATAASTERVADATNDGTDAQASMGGQVVSAGQAAAADASGTQVATTTQAAATAGHGGKKDVITLGNTLKVISQYLSIVAVFATITYVVDHFFRDRRRCAAKAARTRPCRVADSPALASSVQASASPADASGSADASEASAPAGPLTDASSDAPDDTSR